MTEKELDAAADAVHALAEKYNMAFLITRDQEREVAVTVVKAFLKARGEA